MRVALIGCGAIGTALLELVQAFRFGDRAWGVQFHVEADRPLVEAFVGEWPEQADDPAALVAEADQRLDALAPTATSVLGRFAALVDGRDGR